MDITGVIMNREQFEEATELLKQRDALSSWLDKKFIYKITPHSEWVRPLTATAREYMMGALETSARVSEAIVRDQAIATIAEIDARLVELGIEVEVVDEV